MLEKHGWQISEAENGRQAIEMVAKTDYDIILMDIQMPELDGLEATKIIRDREITRSRRTPIIAMTAHAMQGDREQFIAAGMDGYVAKPIIADDLYQTVIKHLIMNNDGKAD